MVEAYQDIEEGNSKRADHEDNSWLLQSKLTERMHQIYLDQIAKKAQ
jgi:hypothetical protein